MLQAPSGATPLLQFLPIILIFGIFYFLLFLPMQRQRKAEQKMRSELQPGDNVVTSGGIIGTVVNVEPDSLIIRVKPSDVKLQISRNAVSALVKPESKS